MPGAASDPEAVGILQAHLDALGDALLAADWPACRDRIHLPHFMATATDTVTMTDEAEIEATFRIFVARYRAERVTDFIRIAKAACFLGPDVIVGRHETHKMSGAHRITPPYPNHIRLAKAADGTWRETHCANAILNDRHGLAKGTDVPPRPAIPELHPDFREVPE